MQLQYSIIIPNIRVVSLFASLLLLACSPIEDEAVVERKIAAFEILHDEGYSVYEAEDSVAIQVIRHSDGWAWGDNKKTFLAFNQDSLKKNRD